MKHPKNFTNFRHLKDVWKTYEKSDVSNFGHCSHVWLTCLIRLWSEESETCRLFRLASIWEWLVGSTDSPLLCRAGCRCHERWWIDQESSHISPDIQTKWKTFRSYLSKQGNGTLQYQFTELTTNRMLIINFLNISNLANVCLSVPIGTASIERSFSQMNLIERRLRNWISQSSLPMYWKLTLKLRINWQTQI